MYGKLDRIEVVVSQSGKRAGRQRVSDQAHHPRHLGMSKPPRRAQRREQPHAPRLPLESPHPQLHLVAAGGRFFLIWHNTIAVSVVRRRTEIGILRALGTSSRGVLLVFLGEAAMLGVIGSALGIILGTSPPRRRPARHDLRHRECTLHNQHSRPHRSLDRLDPDCARHRNRRRLLLRTHSSSRSSPRRTGGSHAPLSRRACRKPGSISGATSSSPPAPPSSRRSSASSDRSMVVQCSATQPRCSQSPQPRCSPRHS